MRSTYPRNRHLDNKKTSLRNATTPLNAKAA
jgi:hypothetical protein